MRKQRTLCIGILSFVMAFSLLCGVINLPAFKVGASHGSYVELYNPTDESIQIDYQKANVFGGSVVDHADTESGKALALDYEAGHNGSVAMTIPTTVKDDENFKGLALWLDIPATADEYSFTMYIVKNDAIWQTLEMGTPLTLISHDGKVSSVSSLWKRFHLNGFKGWLTIPKEGYVDSMPQSNLPYKFVFMLEDAASEGAKRTSDMTMYIGSIGYYTDLNGFMFEKAGEEAMTKNLIAEIEGYISDIAALVPKTNTQVALKNEMLVNFLNLKENVYSLTTAEKVDLANNLYDEYYAYMEDYLYGDIRTTEFIMSFATMADTHFSNTWVNERFLSALSDAKSLDPDLAGVFVLGDISNEGVSPTTPSLTELDAYYDWLDSFEYLNSNGEQIPIRNVLGNHDVRGPSTEPGGQYPQAAYEPAVEMYLEREGVESLQWDMWLNGYHFIFLNPDKYHSDDCYLNDTTLRWLDETLSENEDGRPIFVLIHQPVDRIHSLDSTLKFEEIIARHPSAIVSSGHTHAEFGNARIIQEGKGVYINQPAMVNLAAQYYFVEVYEGGVIYRAREASTKSWIIGSDVVIHNEDHSNNVVLSAKDFDLNSLELTGATATVESALSVSGSTLKLVGGSAGGSVTAPIYAHGTMENFAGYALYVESESEILVEFDGVKLDDGAIYYALVDGELEMREASENGGVIGGGWIMIPKHALSEFVHPSTTTTISLNLSANQVVYLDQVSYYFDISDLLDAITNPTLSFYDDNGSLIVSSTPAYGSELVLPTNPQKQSTVQYDYEFIGWDLDGDGAVDSLPEVVKGSVRAVAVYEANVRQYTYTFYDANGSKLESYTEDYGTTVKVPEVDGLFGWDLDGDGAAENLPAVVEGDFEATAVLGIPPYENATIIFDPAKMSTIPLSTYSYNSAVNLCTVNPMPVTNQSAPSGKVAQFNYKYTDGVNTQNGSDYVQLEIPYSGDVSNFQGYAMWVHVPATEEDFIGGLKINSYRTSGTYSNCWTLIDSEGNVTTEGATWEGPGTFPKIGKGFTGWVIVDKAYFDSTPTSTFPNGFAPAPNGYLYFQIKETGRTTPYEMNIGQILMYSDKQAIISELSDVDAKKSLEYSFSDGNGYVYKAGQVEEGESIVIPENPVHENPDMFFAGWDFNDDGEPDELPADGKITKNIDAVALFYHVNAFTTVNDGSILGWSQEQASISISAVDHADAPTGKAIKVDKALHESITAYVKFTLPHDKQPQGVAVWMDASELNGFGMQLFKNWKAKQNVAEGGDYVYFFGEDGSLTAAAGWRKLAVPANFKGWMIFSMDVFTTDKTIVSGDYLRFGIDSNEDGNVNFEGSFYFGEVVYFDCDEKTFMKQITKKVYGYHDYDQSFIQAGMLEAGENLPVPQDPVREDWTFVGWDVNGDGVADTLPESFDRTFKATAIYTRQFTYKFVTPEGEVILEKTAEYNSIILPPFRYLENDPNFVYEVTYEGYEYGMLLTQNVQFVVRAEVVEVKEYDYSFVVEGNVVASGTLAYGETITAPQAPTKPAGEHESYVFAGWEGYTEGMTITGDVQFNAIFTTVVNKYTVTFKDYDGSVISSSELEYGAVITLPANPSRDGYQFKGWQNFVNGMTVSGDIEFVASYEEISSSEEPTPDPAPAKKGCKGSLGGSGLIFLLLSVGCICAVRRNKQD